MASSFPEEEKVLALFRKYVQEEVSGEVEIRTEIVVGTFGEYFNVAAIDTTAPKGTRVDEPHVES